MFFFNLNFRRERILKKILKEDIIELNKFIKRDSKKIIILLFRFNNK